MMLDVRMSMYLGRTCPASGTHYWPVVCLALSTAPARPPARPRVGGEKDTCLPLLSLDAAASFDGILGRVGCTVTILIQWEASKRDEETLETQVYKNNNHEGAASPMRRGKPGGAKTNHSPTTTIRVTVPALCHDLAWIGPVGSERVALPCLL